MICDLLIVTAETMNFECECILHVKRASMPILHTELNSTVSIQVLGW